MILAGLKLAEQGPHKQKFRKELSDELLEGLVSKGYVQETEESFIVLTLYGVRALLDLEGYDWRTGKRRG